MECFYSRIRHDEAKAVEIVRGAGIDGGDVLIVEVDSRGRLLGLNRYRLAARLGPLRIEGNWPRQESEERVVFEPIGGRYPSIEVVFCPVCDNELVRIRILGRGSEAPG